MPGTFTDEQLAGVKSQLESGTALREVLAGMAIPDGDRRVLMQEMRAKYGVEAVRSMMMGSRPVPTFERIRTLVASLQGRLTAANLDVMEANLDAAKAEIARIRSELQP